MVDPGIIMLVRIDHKAAAWYRWIDRVGVLLAILGGLTLIVALGLNSNVMIVLALPIALTGAIMVVDAVLHEREWVR